MTRGILFHAFNNEQIDYLLIALCNALAAKHFLNQPVCLITDGIEWLVSSRGQELVDKAFDHIIIQPRPEKSSGRRFNDTLSTSHTLPWFNGSRSSSYALSPFDETLLIDVDYLIMDDRLNLVWDSLNDVMINRNATTLGHQELGSSEKWLETTGIRMCWATCVYFRKSQLAEMLFDLVEHVKTNYSYYSLIYGFPTQLFRNDYAFSIAVHMLSGFTVCDDIPSLPVPTMLTSFDCDELIDVPAAGDLTFLMNDRKDRWKFTLTRTKNTSVHVMNKFSITRNAEKFIDLYGGIK